MDPGGGWTVVHGRHIAYVRGWKFVEGAAARAAGRVPVRTLEQALRLVERGRVDVAVGARQPGEALLRARRIDGVRVLEPPILRIPVFLYLHRRHAALVDPLARALRALKADGTHGRMLAVSEPAP
jgi:polar amino acid transport system substrate-binding protein